MLLSNFFRRTKPDGPVGRHRAGPRHLTPQQAADVVQDLTQEPAAEHMLRRYRVEDADTRLMRRSEVLDSIEGGEVWPTDLVRPYTADPDSGATA